MRKLLRPYADPAPLFRHGGAGSRPGLLDFSINVNPLGPPASVLEALRHALPDIVRYPDPECRELTRKLAEHHGVSPEQIVVGNGSNELIHAIARAFRPKRVAIAEPTYTEYLRASLAVGALVDHWLAEGPNFDLEPFDPAGADIVWLCNPNNPTGRMWPARLRNWIESSEARTVFVVDEAFLPLCAGRDTAGLVRLSGRVPNLIVLRSFTKYYAFPGIRLGYAVMNARLKGMLPRLVRAQLVCWSVNSLAQCAGLAALADLDFAADTEAWLMAEHSPQTSMPSLAERLRSCLPQLRLVPSGTCFLLAELSGTVAASLSKQLHQRNIAIRDASNFVGLDEHYIRIAVRTRPENERLLAALSAILE